MDASETTEGIEVTEQVTVEAREPEPDTVAEAQEVVPVAVVEAPDTGPGTGSETQEVEPVTAVESQDAELGAVAATQPGGPEMGKLPVEDWDYQRPRRGQIRTGVILSIEEQEIIIDVDAKRDGIVPYADIQRLGAEALAELSVGDEVDVFILRPEDQDGNLLVSLYQARKSQAWQEAARRAETGEAWEGEVSGFNKGGVVIHLDDIRGFVPASQIPGFPQGLTQEERLKRLGELVGEKLIVKVIELNRRNRRLILSATAAERQWRKEQRRRLLEELREGEVRRGVVSGLASFGAFVDLGGADGLVHISELSWKRVRHPREVVEVGQELDVYVLRLDLDRKRIGLSLKRLQPEPWALVEDKYELGQLVEGRVTNVVDFGAFAEIEEGVEGLIHISELTDQKISHPRDVVKRGDLLLLRIIRIDVRRKRLGLSLKRVLESEWAEWAARQIEKEAEAAEAEEETEIPADEETQATASPEHIEATDERAETVGEAESGPAPLDHGVNDGAEPSDAEEAGIVSPEQEADEGAEPVDEVEPGRVALQQVTGEVAEPSDEAESGIVSPEQEADEGAEPLDEVEAAIVHPEQGADEGVEPVHEVEAGAGTLDQVADEGAEPVDEVELEAVGA